MSWKPQDRMSRTATAGALAIFFSCTTSVCDFLPILSAGIVTGDVLTSQQQPAAGAAMTFWAAMDSSCDLNQFREPVFPDPSSRPVSTDQAGHFSTMLVSANGGTRCVWVVAKSAADAPDSSLVTVLLDFKVDAPVDSAAVDLTLP